MNRNFARLNHPFFLLLFASILLTSCDRGSSSNENELNKEDSLRMHAETVASELIRERLRPKTAADIKLKKSIRFEAYTLEDQYDVDGKMRQFQWDKIKEKLAWIETFQLRKKRYAVLQNYKNINGEAPLVKTFVRNEYTRVSDTLGTERYQSVPLYLDKVESSPEIYGKDGSLVSVLGSDSASFIHIEGLSFPGTWFVPKNYVKLLKETKSFHKVVVVDVTNQHICALEKIDDEWHILSMNPATTGIHKPPYAHETPLGQFVIQDKKEKMYFLKDGSRTEIAGFAPYASRFTNGGYIHGVPTNYPEKNIIEYSWSLGTTPRSHMCVRNASSHAQFIYDWSDSWSSLVVVID